MLKLSIAGRIGQDAVVREPNGKKMLSFSVYSSYKKKDGTYNNTFVNCSYFTDSADTLAQYLKKGKGVYVEGEPSAHSYVKNDGQTEVSLDCSVRHIELCGDSANTQAQPQGQPQVQAQSSVAQPTAGYQPAPNVAPQQGDGDLPF